MAVLLKTVYLKPLPIKMFGSYFVLPVLNWYLFIILAKRWTTSLNRII